MTPNRIIFYILAVFIAGTLLLVYIQYNTSKNISTLITENEKLLGELEVNARLKELEKDIFSVENKIRGTVITKKSIHIEGLQTQIAEIEKDLNQLQKISDDDSSITYIDELDFLVHEKLKFSNQVLNSFHTAGKKAAENLIGTQKDKLLTDSITLFIHKIDSTRKRHSTDVTLSIDKSGIKAKQFSSALIVIVLITAAGLFWYIINIIRKQSQLISALNISEEKVKESARIKELFMANMSHEIRTPMNAVLGFTNLLQRKNLDDESREFVETIQKSGESLLAIINDILDLSKIEAGMMRIESAPFSIRGLAHSVETMFKSKIAEKKLGFSAIINESVPDILEGDVTRLTQIFVNLIDNALKFTGSGSVSVRVSNEGITDQIIKLGITIADTGIGIEKEKLRHIFDRFQQAEDSVTRKYGGTGLGLSIVSDLVLLQKGSIDVKSEPGKGTAFCLVIPYKISSEQSRTISPAENGITLQPDYKGICILVAEDNEINQGLIKHLFHGWKLDFDIANNGKEAIAKLQTKKYDLILMDIQMPEMDGYTTSAEIRNKLKLNTPIIAMTAHALAGEREKCISYGMNEYISKPIRSEQLHNLIAEFTQTVKPVVLQNEMVSINPTGQYKYIDLHYMKEVSNGNMDYEKTVTEQFIEAIPDDLKAMEKAWQNKDVNQLRQLAHNMKTTVSVLGLNDVLQLYLDAIEYESLTEESFQQNMSSITLVCKAALEEAHRFYSAF